MTKDRLSKLADKVNILSNDFEKDISYLDMSLVEKYWDKIKKMVMETQNEENLHEELQNIIDTDQPKFSLWKKIFYLLGKKENREEIQLWIKNINKVIKKILTCLLDDKWITK